MMRYIVSRETYLENLCECYSEPESVADHLKNLVKKHPLFSRMFQKDIRRLTEEDQRELKYAQEIQKEHENGGCMDCPWGNGAGGCGIPGYYQENM